MNDSENRPDIENLAYGIAETVKANLPEGIAFSLILFDTNKNQIACSGFPDMETSLAMIQQSISVLRHEDKKSRRKRR